MRIALGVTGGVAAYKAAELVRRLQQEKLDVQVIMTRSAREFITPLTFAALTGQKVITEMFGHEANASANVESAIEHIAVAQRIDLLVVAPATADILGKFAHGIADDFLTTLYLATKAPVVVAPAMNVNMWEHAATQQNIATLKSRGVHVVEPDEGYLACGMTGAGRLAGIETIARAVCKVLGIRHDLDNETILITAGPTCEDLDPVRFLTNRSSGKMGYALAAAAQRRGAKVILVSGPTDLPAPRRRRLGSRPHHAANARRRSRARRRSHHHHQSRRSSRLPSAVAAQQQKIKRGSDTSTLELEPTPDILAELGRAKSSQVLIGFAAETENVAESARAKLTRKNADMIVANDVTQEGAGFDTDTNVVTIFPARQSRNPAPQNDQVRSSRKNPRPSPRIAPPNQVNSPRRKFHSSFRIMFRAATP